MNSKYECAICNEPVGARFDYCSKCNRNMTDLYGSEWYKLEWAQYAIQNQREMAKLERQETVNIDYTSVSADITGRSTQTTHYVVADKRKDTSYDAEITALIRYGMGARKIHAALVHKHGDKAPSFSTVQRRLREYKA